MTSSRLRSTTTTFGWKGKAVLSLPVLLVLALWVYLGVRFIPALAVALGVPLVVALATYLRHVWAAGRVEPVPPSPPPGTPTPAERLWATGRVADQPTAAAPDPLA